MHLDDHSQANPDIRWKQRFANYQHAYARLAEAVALSKTRPLSRLEQQGLIQVFEFTQELAWQVMKDYFEYQQGATTITGSRDAIRAAFQAGLIEDGESWMDTIKSRMEALTEGRLSRLESLLDDLMLPYQFDLNRFHSLQNGALIEHIERAGKVFFLREKAP